MLLIPIDEQRTHWAKEGKDKTTTLCGREFVGEPDDLLNDFTILDDNQGKFRPTCTKCFKLSVEART